MCLPPRALSGFVECLRCVQWRHASPNIDARKEPKNNPTVKVYQLLEDELARARAGTEGILALTTLVKQL